METAPLATGTLWHRGDRIVFARIITPVWTFHAWTVERDGDGLRVEWHGVPQPGAALSAVEAREDVRGGWLVTGTNLEGWPETWRVVRLSCGCGHNRPAPTSPGDAANLT